MPQSFRPQRLFHLLSTNPLLQTAAPIPPQGPCRVRRSLHSQPCILCRFLPRADRIATIRRAVAVPPPGRVTSTRRSFASVKSSSSTPAQAEGAAAESESLSSLTHGPDITNFYTIFPTTLPRGPPPSAPFEIATPSLHREFLRLQNALHPDKVPAGAAKQRAEALSSRINEAYRTLADPLLRAQYLLREWHGIDVTAEDAATKHALDPETLMEVMKVQETIEEIGGAGEEEAEEAIAQLKRENAQRVEDCVKSLGVAFDTGDIERARAECVRLRFWYSVAEGLREWELGKTEIRIVH